MTKKSTITFGEAEKRLKSVAFSTMIKPIGSQCNMDCHYCYYLDKADLYGGKEPKMSLEMLEEYIKQYIESNDVPLVTFVWHGGEPLLAGVDYYRKAIEFQKRYAGDKQIDNTLQTNGLLVNEEWCEFFKENNFLLGVSIDGPKDIHDAYRLDKGGKPTFDRVMKAIEMFARTGVEYNTLSVVNDLCEGRGAEVYRFMKSIGSHFMQFLPAVEYVMDVEGDSRPAIVPPMTPGSHLAPWSVSSKGYGDFLNDIFDEWVISDVGTYFVQMFDVALAGWVGVRPGLCAFCESCGDAMIVEHNGDVYSCDHFVYPEYKIGNIDTDSLRRLYSSGKQLRFGTNKRNTLPDNCRRCKYNFACRGECPKHRFDTFPNGEKGRNALCEGLYSFFNHVDPYMKYMADLIRNEQPAAYVMPYARQRMGLM